MGKGKNKKKLDDLAAVREVVETLKTFDRDVRERIVRWAHEKLDALAPSAKGKGKGKSKAKGRSTAKKTAKKSAKKTAKKSPTARKKAKSAPRKKAAAKGKR